MKNGSFLSRIFALQVFSRPAPDVWFGYKHEKGGLLQRKDTT
jgi:hypothetical protein